MGWMRLEIGHVLPNYSAPLNYYFIFVIFVGSNYAEFLFFAVQRVTYDIGYSRCLVCSTSTTGRTPCPGYPFFFSVTSNYRGQFFHVHMSIADALDIALGSTGGIVRRWKSYIRRRLSMDW
jgi:hypothetical protein